MLPSFETAHNHNGFKKVKIAQDCCVAITTFYGWQTGRCRVPAHKRASVDRAFGKEVDWVQYDVECAACGCETAPEVPAQPQTAPPALKASKTTKAAPVDDFEALYGEVSS